MNRTDLIILGLSLALIVGLFIRTFHPHEDGAYAYIRSDGASVQRVDLHHDQIIRVKGPLGETVFEVNAGKIRFINSPCPNKICIHSGWHDAAGDFAACLPNRVTLEIKGSTSSYDSLSY